MNDEKLSAFLENFPNPLHNKKPESLFGHWVFWSEDEEERSDNESSSASDVATNRMIISVFSDVAIHNAFILQLWVPVIVGGKQLLSTSGQSFATDLLDKTLANYRLRSLEYQYDIDETDNIEQNPAMIISGAISSAFLNRWPEMVNLKEQGSLLDRYALECGLMTSYVVPICCPSRSTSCCIGVVEFSTVLPRTYGLRYLVNIERALEKVGLSVFDLQERIPYKNINGLKSVRDETEEALKIFQATIVSPIPEALENGKKQIAVNYPAYSKLKSKTAPIALSQKDIEQQYGNTMKEAAQNLSVSVSTLKRKYRSYSTSEWPGPSVTKTKETGSCNNLRDKNEEDNGVIQNPSAVNKNENTVIIKAEWKDDMIKFHLSISEATIVSIEKEIGVQFNLTMGTYKLKYLDEDGDWILLKSDQDVSNCIKSSRKLDRTLVRLRVQQSI